MIEQPSKETNENIIPKLDISEKEDRKKKMGKSKVHFERPSTEIRGREKT